MEISRKIQISGLSKTEKISFIASLKNHLQETGLMVDKNLVNSTITLLSHREFDKMLSETEINLIKKIENPNIIIRFLSNTHVLSFLTNEDLELYCSNKSSDVRAICADSEEIVKRVSYGTLINFANDNDEDVVCAIAGNSIAIERLEENTILSFVTNKSSRVRHTVARNKNIGFKLSKKMAEMLASDSEEPFIRLESVLNHSLFRLFGIGFIRERLKLETNTKVLSELRSILEEKLLDLETSNCKREY